MKTPKKTFKIKPTAKPQANKKNTTQEEDILDVKLMENDFDLPLDDMANLEDFDDDDRY